MLQVRKVYAKLLKKNAAPKIMKFIKRYLVSHLLFHSSSYFHFFISLIRLLEFLEVFHHSLLNILLLFISMYVGIGGAQGARGLHSSQIFI